MVRQMKPRPPRGRGPHGARAKRQIPHDDEVPEAYRELLEEAEARDPEQFASDRPLKKRRTGSTRAIPVGPASAIQVDDGPPQNTHFAHQLQTIYDSTTEDEGSDVEWEDVQITQPAQESSSAPTQSYDRDEPMVITLDPETQGKKQAALKVKRLSTAERKVRLDVHKTHLLCLLAHVHMRNKWCNDVELQTSLRKMVPKAAITLLHPPENKPGYARSVSFMNGLNQVADIFNKRFRVTTPGMRQPHWAENENQLKQKMESIIDTEKISSREEFKFQAQAMQGSRDLGAQLFCALLRSVTIDARILCSLQPLPFTGGRKDMTPSKSKRKPIVISSDDTRPTGKQNNPQPSTPSRARRIGRPGFASRPATSPSTRPQPTLQGSSYPIFWVEAYNEGAKKWIVVDPIVTKTLAKPEKMEPPLSDMYNTMAYVVAFEDDASVRDVTRRYSKAFNAKTRKNRVENTEHGEKWWKKVMMAYEKPFLEDRDEAEITELASLSAAEPMPRNIIDFKNHPFYALERHLHRNQVFHPPGRVIGHVGLSRTTANSDNSEPVYRRSDVHTVRSAARWYRSGRDVKAGEQPLKHLPKNRPHNANTSGDEEEEVESALYAEFQTELYVPPPVVQGRIPKNAFGNLDVYVPSMVPAGAVHINHKEASRAARILGIDYADAVTGFDFQGRARLGTAIVKGVVIAKEFQEALEEVLRSFVDEREQAAIDAKTEESLKLWRLFLIKLRISERVKGYASDGEHAEEQLEQDVELAEAGGGFFPEEGGFLPEPDQPVHIPPTDMSTPPADDLPLEYERGGFVREPDAPRSTEDLTGGHGLDGSPDDTKEDFSARDDESARLRLSPQKPQKKRRANIPHYDLIVVPNTTNSSPQPLTIPETSSAEQTGQTSHRSQATVDAVVHEGSTATNRDDSARSNLPAPEPDQPENPRDSDSEIEKGSLLSEDPEDEDAIPDWLL